MSDQIYQLVKYHSWRTNGQDNVVATPFQRFHGNLMGTVLKRDPIDGHYHVTRAEQPLLPRHTVLGDGTNTDGEVPVRTVFPAHYTEPQTCRTSLEMDNSNAAGTEVWE